MDHGSMEIDRDQIHSHFCIEIRLCLQVQTFCSVLQEIVMYLSGEKTYIAH